MEMQAPAPLQPESLPLREARSRFFAESGLPADGGYGKRWFRIAVGRVGIYLPNVKARVEALPMHDIHHIVAGYAADWRGEGEVGAWEIAGGCGRYWVAWVLNFGTFTAGLFVAPVRTWRAFARGRQCRNLYGGEFNQSVLDETVGAVRQRLGLATPLAQPSTWDNLAFAGWSVFVVCWHLAPLVAGLVIIDLVIA
jgi:hypothetical protein